MFKLTTRQAKFVVGALAGLRYQDLAESISNAYRRDPAYQGQSDNERAMRYTVNDSLYQVSRNGVGQGEESFVKERNDVIRAIGLQNPDLQREFGPGSAPANETTLVDTIVDALTGPYVRNVLSWDIITRLRNAVLTHKELSEVKTTLANREKNCIGCGHTFTSGEAVTIINEGYGMALHCVLCSPPTHAPCANKECGRGAPLGKKHRKILKGIGECPTCRTARAAATPNVAPADAQDGGGTEQAVPVDGAAGGGMPGQALGDGNEVARTYTWAHRIIRDDGPVQPTVPTPPNVVGAQRLQTAAQRYIQRIEQERQHRANLAILNDTMPIDLEDFDDGND